MEIMKKYLLGAVLFFGMVGRVMCQELPTKEGKIVYERVISIDGVSKEDIFNNTLNWLPTKYKNPKAVIQSSDVNSGIIICKSNKRIIDRYLDDRPQYTLSFEIKEGKVRSRVTNIYFDFNWHDTLENVQLKKQGKKNWTNTVEVINKNFNDLLDDYVDYIEKSKVDTF